MKKRFLFISSLAVAALVVQPLAATTMLQMDLADLTDRAGQIFRGTVVDVEPGSMALGGGDIPVVTYTFKVEDLFKGEADLVKGDDAVISVTMVGSIKDSAVVAGAHRFSIFRDVPRLTMGSDYVLFVTPQSGAGLSVTVGLGQGAFSVFSQDKTDFAVNEFDNIGLGLGASGPVEYTELAAKILALLGQ